MLQYLICLLRVSGIQWRHQDHQNPSAQGHIRASSLSSGMAVTAVPAGHSAPSPSPRPKSPVSRLFQPSSSRQSDLTTESHSSKAAGQLSDTISSIGGRARTLSTYSDSKNLLPNGAQERADGVAESSFGIGELPTQSSVRHFYLYKAVSKLRCGGFSFLHTRSRDVRDAGFLSLSQII